MVKPRIPLTADIKRQVQQRANGRCERCRRSFNTEGYTPHFHHIDEDSTNNELKNIRFLCPNCHSYYTRKLKDINKLMKQIKQHSNYATLSESEKNRLERRLKEIRQKRNLDAGIRYLKDYIRRRLDKKHRGFFDW